MLIRNSIRVTTPNSKYTVFNYIESYPHILVSNSNNLIINKK